MRTRFYTDWIERLFLQFILCQPFLDLLTSLAIRYSYPMFTIGILARTAFLVLALFYLFFRPKYGPARFAMVLLLALTASLAVQITANASLKPVFSFPAEISYTLKILYFPLSLFTYRQLFLSDDSLAGTAERYIAVSIGITGFIMILAGMSGSAYPSYEGGKAGHTGWFYAGNEIAALLAIGFPVVLLFALNRGFAWWPAVLAVLYSLFALGTKVGLGAIIITLSAGILSTGLMLLRNREKRKAIVPLCVLICLLVGSALYTPHSPVVQNVQIHMEWLGMDKQTQMEVETKVSQAQMDNLVYSGREKYLENQANSYHQATLTQKLFGLGYAGNYTEEPKLVEMDFHDLFFSIGLIGFALYLALVGIACGWMVKSIRWDSIKVQTIMKAVGVVLGFGIAYTAGHVLTAPGVSIYLAILLASFTKEAIPEMKESAP
jgi:O-antigen ligase like membrane protein